MAFNYGNFSAPLADNASSIDVENKFRVIEESFGKPYALANDVVDDPAKAGRTLGAINSVKGVPVYSHYGSLISHASGAGSFTSATMPSAPQLFCGYGAYDYTDQFRDEFALMNTPVYFNIGAEYNEKNFVIVSENNGLQRIEPPVSGEAVTVRTGNFGLRDVGLYMTPYLTVGGSLGCYSGGVQHRLEDVATSPINNFLLGFRNPIAGYFDVQAEFEYNVGAGTFTEVSQGSLPFFEVFSPHGWNSGLANLSLVHDGGALSLSSSVNFVFAVGAGISFSSAGGSPLKPSYA